MKKKAPKEVGIWVKPCRKLLDTVKVWRDMIPLAASAQLQLSVENDLPSELDFNYIGGQ